MADKNNPDALAGAAGNVPQDCDPDADEAKLALIEDPDTVDACASTGGRAIEFVSR